MSLLRQPYKDIGLRPLTDIDLWVLPESFAGVQNVLTQMGFQQDRLYPHTFRKGATIIDINCHIYWADRIRSRRMLFDAHQEKLYLNCWMIEFEGEKAYCLSETDQFLYLSLHAIKHYAERLIWLVDLKNLLQNWKPSSWALLVENSCTQGHAKVVSYILFLLVGLFGIQTHHMPDALAAESGISRLERMLLDRRLRGSALAAWSPLLLLTSGKGFWKSAAFAFESLFPRPEILRQVFANTSHLKIWQLYLKRALQLVSQARS